jgi:uncharacterized membrane protein YhiD involved in acid resistance
MINSEHIALIFSLLVSILLSFALIYIYKRFSLSVYKRKNFEQNFIIIAPVITILIFIVKSNLALSLGLVGALSIIRYRTAIKDPEEIAYLFICVAIGVGTGASFNLYTIIAILILIGVIVLNSKRNKDRTVDLGYLIEVQTGDIKENLDELVKFMNKNTNNLIRRLHIDDEKNYQLVFEIINFNNEMNITSISEEIKKIIHNAKIDITSLNNDIENL